MKGMINKLKVHYLMYPREFNALSVTILALLLGASDVYAQTTDPWQNFSNLLITWINGNLGKTLTLLGMVISVLMLLVTHSWRVFLYGIIISVIIGGLVGIAKTFHEAGATAFGNNW